MRKILSVAALAMAASTAAQAQNLALTPGNIPNQAAFRALSEDLGSALSYKPNTTTEPLAGLVPFGFDIGVSATTTKLANASKYGNALEGDTSFIQNALRAYVGLPFGIDIGLAQTSQPSGNLKSTSGELRYAILKGGVVEPALGVRASFSKVSGVDALDFSSKGLDISVSKGILFFTPYIGAGINQVSSKGTVGATSYSESFSQNKVYGGVGFKMLLITVNFEADKTGDAESYSAKIGLRF